VHYFISGAAGQLRKGNVASNASTACGFDQDNSFMLVELTPNAMRFESVSRDGRVVDSGAIRKDASEVTPQIGCSAGQ
jgi:hypothetical protein